MGVTKGDLQVKIDVQYATHVNNLIVKNFSLRFWKFKHLQVSICAELEEEMIIRDREKNCQIALQAGRIRNGPNTSQGHIRRSQPSCLPSKMKY